MEKIRAYMLEVGDRFLKQGINYRVRTIEAGKFIVTAASTNGTTESTSKSLEIGTNSQERVELITKTSPDRMPG